MTSTPAALEALDTFGIEVPSWAYGNSGTRFKVFSTPGVPRDPWEKLADVAQQAGSQAKQAASSLASDANQRAKGFLNQQVASGADLVGHVADSVRSAADNLDHSAPQIANLVRGAAERVEEFSDDMRGKSVDELMRTASDFTRRQPALVFGLASLAGFVLLRVLKSSSPDNVRDHGADRFERSRQFHGV